MTDDRLPINNKQGEGYMKKMMLFFIAFCLVAGLAFAEVMNYTLPVPGVV
jgi:hypothetical protein